MIYKVSVQEGKETMSNEKHPGDFRPFRFFAVYNFVFVLLRLPPLKTARTREHLEVHMDSWDCQLTGKNLSIQC